MKMVILDAYSLNPGDLSWNELAGLGELTCHDFTPPEAVAPRCRDADMIFTNNIGLTAETIAACPKLRYIGLFATGFNHVDVAAARRRNIPVTNVPDYSTMAVAQHVMALLLEITNRVGHFDQALRAGRWTNLGDRALWDYPLIELADLTLGVVGYGRIGAAVGTMALGMGMRVVANRTRRDIPPEDPRITYADLDDLYARSDVISLHVPASPATIGMLDSAAIAKMKPGVIIINAGRGQLVVEEDLAQALASGRVYAYGADVTAVEPVRMDNPLLSAPNCYLTPHLAWVPRATRRRLLRVVAENAAAFLKGTPVNVVN